MDDRRVGLIMRALRRGRGWRQLDLAQRSGVSQSVISEAERGHIDDRSIATVRRVFKPLDAEFRMEIRWRGGDADRLLDEDHARLVGAMAGRLLRLGWEVRTEVTYSEYGERGSYDLLAWQAHAAHLAVVEVKTELLSAEATLRKMDEKVRLAPEVVRERFGWRPASVSRVLALGEGTTNRRRLRTHADVFGVALPDDPSAVRRWLADPAPGTHIDGWLFLPLIGSSGDKQARGGRHRVRRPRPGA